MKSAEIRGVAEAQRVAREAVLSVAESVRPGDTERAVVARMEREFVRAKVRHWLHTPYAWWGERSRFDNFPIWETSALPTERRLQPGEPFILDAAPLVAGFPADFAYSGCASGASADDPVSARHARALSRLSEIKRELVAWTASALSGGELCDQVAADMDRHGFDAIHPRYPAAVLGHTLSGFPNLFSTLPRLGSGFQLPLLLSYGLGLIAHQLLGRPYPFLNAGTPGAPEGLYAIEPHLGLAGFGAKFESVLLVAGSETRWLDPELFGEVSP
jgi:Xaa-Pro aminopeptidase